MAIAASYPALRPSLLLDFANAKAVDPRITFTRSTTAKYYDGVTTAKAEENLLTYSQEFDNAAWSLAGSTTTANSTAAPDGTTTADSLLETAATSLHRVRQTIGSAGTYTVSVFVKPNGRDFIAIAPDDSGTVYAVFNLATGTVGTTAGGVTNATITASTNGFYRVSVTLTLTTSGPYFQIRDADSAPANYAGDVTKGLYIWGAQIEARSAVTAYTPTTTQPITNYIPVLQTAAAGVPRIDHDPVTGECLGLLIEEQRTNLLTYSEDFGNAAWAKTNATVTANAIVAPDGTLTGDKLVENTSNADHYIQETATVSNATVYAFSAYVKAGERSRVRLLLTQSTSPFTVHALVVFDLLTGTVSSTTTGTGSITSVGNNWYRVIVVGIPTTSTGELVRISPALNDNTITYTGDGYSGIFIWGAQLEAGAFPTSYIPTVATQQTRNADAASMTGTNFSSWFNAGEGSVFADFVTSAPASVAAAAFAISNGSIDQLINTYVQGAMVQQVRNATTQASLAPSGSFSSGVRVKSVVAAEINNFAGAANGGAVVTDTVGIMPQGADRLQIGSNGAVTVANVLNGTIKKIAYYPQRLSDTNLQALTA